MTRNRMTHMKRFICLLCIAYPFVACAMEELTYEIRDFPQEFEAYHTDRWPQSLVNFYNSMQNAIERISNQLSSIPENFYLFLLSKDSRSKKVATVRHTETDDIPLEEMIFLSKRAHVTQKQLETLFNVPLDQ